MSARGPTSIDKHVGARLRLRRSMLDMSQSELGEKLGVTFQQVQKYERGTNRIGASRLFNVARVMDVPVAYFFEGLDEEGTSELKNDDSATLYDFIASPDGLALASAFAGIQDQTVRRRVIDLLRSLSD
ncbi:MAG: helix-turn-helix transcriptional regulator [Maricaulis sp.]|jgi:transcriptional regulator with XRE-family HTH domain|nr:helix-turn-helix transcriptional regulator [Maricaulis sp.]MDG2044418.1 helix-turn-helix transcriptional regulator [Maricaulis sp.]